MPHTREYIHGARWWKMDFHTHTPASMDYGRDNSEKQIQPQEWLLGFMRAGIDCVAVTDHNTGNWIDSLKTALKDLRESKPEGYRPLHLFPGVEITVNGNIHVLALFDDSADTSTISGLLGNVGFDLQHQGTSEAVTQASLEQVLAKIINLGGIAIPAHVDKRSGLFTATSGYTTHQALTVDGLLALEIVDPTFAISSPYDRLSSHLASVVGTDSHSPTTVGSNYTWVKMHHPSLDALKLALHDAEDGVIRKDQLEDNSDPNIILERYFIKSITIKDGFKIGRGKPVKVEFSPWMTSIIGGRGSGKSSVVNFLRMILGKGSELPEGLTKDYESFFKVGSRTALGMLTESCNVQIEIFKDAQLYSLCWSQSERTWSMATKDFLSGGWSEYTPVTDVSRLFPTQIYSQKQLYMMTEDPSRLLNIIDSKFDKSLWQAEYDSLVSSYLKSRSTGRSLKRAVGNENQIRAEIELLNNKATFYESSQYADILANYKRENEFSDRLSRYVSEFSQFATNTQVWANSIPSTEVLSNIAEQTDPETTAYLSHSVDTLSQIQELKEQITTLLQPYQNNLQGQVSALPWKSKFDSVKAAYDQIQIERGNGVDSYESVLKRRAELTEKVELLDKQKQHLVAEQSATAALYEAIIAKEKELRDKRNHVISVWNSEVSSELVVELDVMGNSESAEYSFRQLIRKPGGEFARYIHEISGDDIATGLIGDLKSGDDKWQTRTDLLSSLLHATEDSREYDSRLIRHLNVLRTETPEDIDRLSIWVPEDRVKLQIRRDGDLRSIHAASAGERTAAMLSLLLTLYIEPLIVDQPEDDLDTSLISNMIVPALRNLKYRRQIIVVTHNPNIAVNTNSENIVHMNFRAGQIEVASNSALQDRISRAAVCTVMEGGKDALNKRYYRISKALS